MKRNKNYPLMGWSATTPDSEIVSLPSCPITLTIRRGEIDIINLTLPCGDVKIAEVMMYGRTIKPKKLKA